MTTHETDGLSTRQMIEADRRVPDVARFAGGVSSDEQHAVLRASVRQLGTLLGEALTRHEGPELLELVERVRALGREEDDEPLHDLLAGVDDATAVLLARAFTAYFQLVNVTEQLHRWQELTTGEQGPLAEAAGRIGAAIEAGTVDRDLVAEVLGRLEYRPVFTAHPTEASRRSVLELLRRIADLVHAAEDPRRPPADAPRAERRLAELVDLLWQTDELRVTRPEPKDEARSAIYYLQTLATTVVPDLLGELDRVLGLIGVALPVGARPLRFGTWAGGDRDGNPHVTPQVTLDVLGLQHDFGLRVLLAEVEDLLTEMSPSTRVVAASEELTASLERDAEALPITFEAVRRVNAEEPYRLKLTYVRVRLERTRDRFAHDTAHEPGRDYLTVDELLADLSLVRDSMLAGGDELTGNGAELRLIRTPPPSAWGWRRWTSASTAARTTRRSPRSTTGSGSSRRRTPSWTVPPGPSCCAGRWPAGVRWSGPAAPGWARPRSPVSTCSRPSGGPWTPSARRWWRPTSSR
jgi:phosphoenolpyruvate carboxylase